MYQVTVQRHVAKNAMPSIKELKNWAITALKKVSVPEHVPIFTNNTSLYDGKMGIRPRDKLSAAEMNLRIVDVAEMTELNHRYRQKDQPTNVLSFSLGLDTLNHEDVLLLGDIIICADVVNHEAEMQGKSLSAHWAHMVVHGTLHLLGYDHETAEQAAKMEPQEIIILSSLGFPDPYYER